MSSNVSQSLSLMNAKDAEYYLSNIGNMNGKE